jgi:hypothetical protein
MNGVRPTVKEIRRSGELFVGMANGPYMLLLSSRHPHDFLHYARRWPRHRIAIGWNPEYHHGRTWFIRPIEDRDAYRLEFRVPKDVYRWVFEVGRNSRERALWAKERLFSSISIYHREKKCDRIFSLQYDPNSVPRGIHARRHAV